MIPSCVHQSNRNSRVWRKGNDEAQHAKIDEGYFEEIGLADWLPVWPEECTRTMETAAT